MPHTATEKRKAATRRPVHWRKPDGRKRPPVIDATCGALVRGIEKRLGPLWLRVHKHVAVAGYPKERAFDRVRALRSDGAASLLAMIVALLFLVDVRTGFIGKPGPTGGPWKRYDLRDLAQLAFGAQGEAEIRRASRAIDMLSSLGWIWPSKQVRRHVGDCEFRSEPSVRRLNLTRLCAMTGTAGLLKSDRKFADRQSGVGTPPLLPSHDTERAQHDVHPAGRSTCLPQSRPSATGDPPGLRTAAECIAEIGKMLGR